MDDRLRLLRDPRAWLVQAGKLKRAADLVGSQFQGEFNGWALHELQALPGTTLVDDEGIERQLKALELALPAYMLIGYAIECLAKGLIISLDDSDKTVDWMSNKHVGSLLLKHAGVELSAGERFLVDKRLYHAVKWSGRYPAPLEKDAKLFEAQVVAANGFILSDPRGVSGDHYRQGCELYDRLESELMRQIAEARRKRLTPETLEQLDTARQAQLDALRRTQS